MMVTRHGNLWPQEPMQENTLTVNGETIPVPEISLLELETLKPELDLIGEAGESVPKSGWGKARAMATVVCQVIKRDNPGLSEDDIRKAIPLGKLGDLFTSVLGREADPKPDLPQVTPS
jgi:hypothetical protein